MSEERKIIHNEIASATVKVFVYGEFMGTGFFITPNGYLLTAFHCIKKPIPKKEDIEIEIFSGERFNAQIDLDKSIPESEIDIAVLQVEYQPKHYLSLGTVTEQHVTDDIVILGYPAGSRPENQKISTVVGKITKVEGNYIQSDAVEGQGQSGSPVYHYATKAVIGLVSFGYPSNILANLGMAVRLDKLFAHWPEIMPLSERLTRFMQQIEGRKKDILFIWKQVNKYLRNLKKIGIDDEAQDILSDIKDFLANEMTPQEFIACWQQEDEQSIKYDKLANKLKKSEIAIFLGSKIPDQITLQLATSFDDVNGSFSEICEYVELNTDYSRNLLRDEIKTLMAQENSLSEPLYKLLSELPFPIVIIHSGYDKLLEDAFQRNGKRFAVISHSLDGKIMVKCSDKLEAEICKNNDNLSGLQLFENNDGYSLIYKINGCISSIPNVANKNDALLLAEHDYFEFVKYMDKLIPNYVIGQLQGRDLWFLGQYPKNWENRLIMQAILEKRGTSNNAITTIHKDADEFAKTYWKAKNVQNYPIELEEFVENLQKHI